MSRNLVKLPMTVHTFLHTFQPFWTISQLSSVWRSEHGILMQVYPLISQLTQLCKITMFRGKPTINGSCSIAMLVYQRIAHPHFQHRDFAILQGLLPGWSVPFVLLQFHPTSSRQFERSSMNLNIHKPTNCRTPPTKLSSSCQQRLKQKSPHIFAGEITISRGVTPHYPHWRVFSHPRN